MDINYRKIAKFFTYVWVFACVLLLFIEDDEMCETLFYVVIFVPFPVLFFWLKSFSTHQDTPEDEGKDISLDGGKEELAYTEQLTDESIAAYQEISNIWNYGIQTMLAVSTSKNSYNINYIKVRYTNSTTTPWIIVITDPIGYSREFNAKRKDDKLIGLRENTIAIMSDGQLMIDDNIYFFSPTNEHIEIVSETINTFLTEKKIETIKYEHLKVGQDFIDELPKFHFSITKGGIKCDEINYPQRHLEEFFDKNNGGEYVFQNKVFYDDYCRNNYLYKFDAFQEKDFLNYMSNMSWQSVNSRYSCNTNFTLSQWQVSINMGLENLFRTFKSYVDKETLDVVPCAIQENNGCKSILFKHKIYFPPKTGLMTFLPMVLELMHEDRKGKNIGYLVHKDDEGRIHIDMNGEVYVSVEKTNVS